LTQYSTTYPSLSPRIMKTLLLALVSNGKSCGTREGAVRGLVGVGKEAIRKGLIEGHGAKVVASECTTMEYASLIDTVLVSCLTYMPIISTNLIANSGRSCYLVSTLYASCVVKPTRERGCSSH
jgi:hypothetical protein